MTKKAPIRSSQAPRETPKLQYLKDTESGAEARALQDAGATQLRADGESESVSRKETCASRTAVPDAGARVGREKRWFSLEVAKQIPRNSA